MVNETVVKKDNHFKSVATSAMLATYVADIY